MLTVGCCSRVCAWLPACFCFVIRGLLQSLFRAHLYSECAASFVYPDRALGCVLTDDLADLILLGNREFVARHVECPESCLPGKEDQQRGHALFPLICKPWFLTIKSEALQPGDTVVSEDLHQLLALFGTAARASDAKSAETVRGGGD